jgi:hypothetical protein
MSQVQQVKVGSATFNVAQASAETQKKLLLLIGAQIAHSSYTSRTIEINEGLLVGSLLRLPETTFDEVSGIVLCQTFKNGGSELVTIRDFQGQMTNYFKLVAGAIKVNLQDFFTYLDEANAGLTGPVNRKS